MEKVNLALAGRCVICGARVVNMNPKCFTCDPICTRARHSGRTRDEQIRQEMIEDQQRDLRKWRKVF
jgi:hypothetical protein